jgi:glycosyltransferase involved in cell wall biosynthesis
MKPKVSVCIITYNHERFIAQALDSVLSQETDFEFEVVVGEDCSTDSTAEIVQQYAQRYPSRVRALIREKNLAGRNLETTINECRGQYVALLEGDDYWTSRQKLERQVSLLDRNPRLVGCFHRATVVDELGAAADKSSEDAPKSVLTLSDVLGAGRNLACMGSLLFRRTAFQGFPQWAQRLPFRDWPLVILLAEQGNLGYLGEEMSVRRRHSAGAWAPRDKRYQACRRMCLLG